MSESSTVDARCVHERRRITAALWIRPARTGAAYNIARTNPLSLSQLFFAEIAMSSPVDPTPVAAAKPRRPRYPATVKRVETITPRMVRVTFTSPELANFGWNGPAAHIKLIFAQPAPESPGAEPPRPTMRTYTPRRFDRATRELDVDFILHGEGPASTWAEQAAVGQ